MKTPMVHKGPNVVSISGEASKKILAHLRRRATASFATRLLIERHRHAASDRLERRLGLVKIVKARRAAGEISLERYIALAGTLAEQLNETRWTDGEYDQELTPYREIMRRAAEAAGFNDMESFGIGEGPPDYEAANAAYEEILDNHLVDVFHELGLDDIATLWVQDREAYERLSRIGSRLFRETAQPIHAVEAVIAIYETDAERCEQALAFYGACAMLGAAAEARLLARALRDPGGAEAARIRLDKADRPRRSDPHGWTFDQLVSIAVEANWIGVIPDDESGFDFVVAGLLRELRQLRNYVHAGRHAFDKPQEVLTAEEMADARAAYDSLIFSLESSLLGT